MAKTKVKLKNVDKVVKTIKDTFSDVKTSKRLLSRMGTFTQDRIKSFARSGKSLVSGRPVNFPNLEEITKQFRRDFRDAGLADSPFFDAERNNSNLTLTGDLLNAVKARIEGSTLVIFVEENRRDGESNKKIIRDLLKIDDGYAFLGLDDKGIDRLRKLVLDELRREIKRNNLKK